MTTQDSDLQDQQVLVTGATSGIGRVCAPGAPMRSARRPWELPPCSIALHTRRRLLRSSDFSRHPGRATSLAPTAVHTAI
jgi:hypothetical protein